jgi:hypothetical protein
MTLTVDRPKRLSLADLDETCQSYPEHIRREKNWMTFQRAVSIILHFFGREWVENNIIQDEKRSRPAAFFPHGFQLGLRAGEEDVPRAGFRRDPL